MEPRYIIQNTLHDDFQPPFSYETQVSLGIMHSDSLCYTTPAYHYYDCKCVECYKNHYPCDNVADCDYCGTVQSLMYVHEYDATGNIVQVPTGKQIKPEWGHIIDYVTYQELGDVEIDPNDLLWEECMYCNILVCKYTYDMHGGYCSELCKENDTIYCRVCGEIEVNYEGDRCRECTIYCSGRDGDCENEVDEEWDLCDYCSSRDDGSGYCAGDVVIPDDYAELMNCWIDTRGRVRYVPYCNHDYAAEKMGYRGTYDAECAGNIHVSEYWDSYDRWRFVPARPTQAQLDTMVALCLANPHNLKMPSILKKHMEERSNKSSVVYVGNLTTSAYYSLPIATRRALHQGD